MKVLVPTSIELALDGHDAVSYDPAAPIPTEHRDADVLVTWRNTDAAIADAAQHLDRVRLVQTLAAGPDQALAAGFGPDVAIASGRSLHDDTVAEHALALVLAVLRGIPRTLEAQAQHRWASDLVAEQRDPATTAHCTLHEASVGIWGFGSIAARLAPLLAALGARVTGIARSAGDRHGFPVVAESEVDTLLPSLDVLISILPATPETDGVLGADVFQVLPDHAVFVNVGRGAVVDETALVTALETGELRAAALDVMRTEPLPGDSPLWDAPNILLTPHIAGDRPRGASALVQENLDALDAGTAIRNRVR